MSVTAPDMDIQDYPGGETEAGRWLTYNELASARGISRGSAERLARRKKWRRQTANDGTARIFVPQDEATLTGEDVPTDVRQRRADPVPILRVAVETLRDQLATLRDQVAREGVRADREASRADAAEARAGQAERDLAAARSRTDQREVEMKEARAAQARAEQAATELQDRLEGELEAEKIASAEAQADLAELRERHAREVAVAEHDAKVAQQTAAELRLSEATRRGQGRWARLRAAWRGE